MNRLLLLVTLGAVAMPAAASPTYDTVAYCQSVSAAVGGSYQIEAGCRAQEERGRAEFAAANYPQRIADYCDGVAKAVGGSYQILAGCAQNEAKARDGMR